jgi:putative glutamine amidotransferase
VRTRIGLTYRFESKAQPYRLALRDAGLDIVDVTPEAPHPTLEGLSGLLLSGGSDIEPRRYGQVDASARKPDPPRDELELRLAREALAAGMPVLGICRGMQLLNVALGGTLLQDIGDAHTLVMHPVCVTSGTRLHSILGPAVEANSRHHQAVDRFAPRLIGNAVAPDGIVEGVELPGEAFVLGVQWHPEDLSDRRLFDAFREAVRIWKQ